MGRISFVSCLIFIIIYIQSTSLQEIESQRLIAELQLNDLELIDSCENIALASKAAVLNHTYHNKILEEQHYGAIIKSHYNVLREFVDIPIELERNWTYQIKPGNFLLPQDKWSQLIFYKNRVDEHLRESKVVYHNTNNASNCIVGKSDYYQQLNKNRQLNDLTDIWQQWQEIYNDSLIVQFNENLKLVKEAAKLNEFESVQEYWESLIDFSNAYEQADIFWEELSPFYKKLHDFIKTRLFKYYNIPNNSTDIPAYLLGSQLGVDWSNVADIILPHPQFHYEVEFNLQYKNAESLYQYANSLISDMGLPVLDKKFWRYSKFNASVCGTKLFVFCDRQFTELMDCNKSSWSTYWNSINVALKIALYNLDYASWPRQQFRYCPIDDAVQTLGSLLAIERLEHHGIVANDNESRENDPKEMTKLLLMALRVMPRLAYSMMMDKWRLHMIKNNITNVAETWWKFRREYMGVDGLKNIENEYLEDSKIVANEPYINEFFGILVGFQLFQYYRERVNNPKSITKELQEDNSLISLIKSRHSNDWPYLLSLHYGLDVGTDELLKFFEPLQHYMDNAPVDQSSLIIKTTTSATTTTTTTSTTTTSTTPLPQTHKSATFELVNDQPKMGVQNSSIQLFEKVVEKKVDNRVAMIVGVGLLALLACVLLAAFGYKTVKRKRRTNNRRFDN